MKTLNILALMLMGLMFSLSAQAAIDGSKPFICTVRIVHDCDIEGCESGMAEEINMAGFARIDLKKKRIEAIGKDRVTPIEYMETPEDGGWIIGGVDGIRGWSATIADESGEFTGAIAADGYAFTLHGVCAQF
jgi:hypothetical protein